jgi:hypothetical protein
MLQNNIISSKFPKLNGIKCSFIGTNSRRFIDENQGKKIELPQVIQSLKRDVYSGKELI